MTLYSLTEHVSGAWAERKTERSVSGAENGAERAENRVERSEAWSGLNRPLTVRSNLSFHSTDFMA